MWHTVVRVTIVRPRTIIILVYGTDPNGGEPCVLYVVKVLANTVPGSTTPMGNEKELNEAGRDDVPCPVLGFASVWVCTSWEGVTVRNDSFRFSSEQFNHNHDARCALVYGA